MTILSGGGLSAAHAQNTTSRPSASTPPPAQSSRQDAPDAAVTPQDIVVTATRQGQVIAEVPLSVQAFTTKQMDEQGVRRIDDIATLTPGLVPALDLWRRIDLEHRDPGHHLDRWRRDDRHLYRRHPDPGAPARP